jgi:hypothetical protein
MKMAYRCRGCHKHSHKKKKKILRLSLYGILYNFINSRRLKVIDNINSLKGYPTRFILNDYSKELEEYMADHNIDTKIIGGFYIGKRLGKNDLKDISTDTIRRILPAEIISIIQITDEEK